MSTLSQSERQALNDVFGAIDTEESFLSKVKNSLSSILYFLKYLFKEKTRTKISLR